MCSDTTEFPLPKLDFLSLNEIYSNMTLVDLFELSFTNDDVKDTLKEASVPIRFITIAFDSRTPSIHLESGRNKFLWSFGTPDEDTEIIGEGEYQIRQFKFKCKKTTDGYHTEHFDVEHGMLAVIRYIVSIFNCAKTVIKELSIGLGVVEDIRSVCEHFTKFKNIERLAIHQSVDIERNKLNFAQNFDWIMDNLKIKEMYVGVELLEHKMVRTQKGGFEIRPFAQRLDKTLKVEHFCLEHANWFTAQDLMELDAKTAIIGDNQLTAEDLNAFMKQWLKSTSNTLFWLEVKFNSEDPTQVDKILEGLNVEASTYRLINSKCSCKYRRFDSLEPVPFEFPENCKQITRGDGSTSATISIVNDTFFFHVKNDGPITTPPPPPPPPPPQPPQLPLIIQQMLANDELAEFHEEELQEIHRAFLEPFGPRIHELDPEGIRRRARAFQRIIRNQQLNNDLE